MVENNQTFVKVTNRDIYFSLKNIEKLVLETNGKVRHHTRWLYGLSTLLLLVLGAIVKAGIE